MSRWLPTMLDQRVGRIGSSKLTLQAVGQVKIIDGENRCRKRKWSLAELFSNSRSLTKSREIRHMQWKQGHGVDKNHSSKTEVVHREPGTLEEWRCRRPWRMGRLICLSQGIIHIYVAC